MTAPRLEYLVQQGALAPLRPSRRRPSPRRYSLENVYEAAIASQLTEAGMSATQLVAILSGLRVTLAPIHPNLRASALFVKYVAITKAMATILGVDHAEPYLAWVRQAEALVLAWPRPPVPFHERLLPLVAVRAEALARIDNGNVHA